MHLQAGHQNGTIVHDIRIDVSGELTVSRPLLETQAIEVLATAVERTPTLNHSAAKYFALGIAEDDQLKRFLYFFLSLEVETHAVFSQIDHATSLGNQIFRDGVSVPRPSTAELITRDVSKWVNLFDRFVWCTTCSWPNLVDDDVTLFKNLKKARDAIAHGRASEPPADFARKAGTARTQGALEARWKRCLTSNYSGLLLFHRRTFFLPPRSAWKAAFDARRHQMLTPASAPRSAPYRPCSDLGRCGCRA